MDISELYNLFKQSNGVSTDTRTIKGGEIFFGLKGETFDGSRYAAAALEKGASYAVVNEYAASDDERVISVPDTLKTLQELARWHREHIFVNGKRLIVIGLTGTNGKTTTKNLITSVLSKKYNVTATEGNLNNDIGVPLSILKINGKTELAVIEMGASHPDDIKHLVAVSEPDYGLITNVGRAHLLGFGSFEGVKKAKGQLYDYIAEHHGSIFLNADDPILTEMASERKGLNIIEYGIGYWGAVILPSDADHPFLRMAVPEKLGSHSEEETLLGIETHLVGAYNANNVAAALAIGQNFGVSLEDSISAVEEFVPSNNRSQMARTQKNILIEDFYNANPTSMNAALDNLESVNADKKAVMLGDMRELGDESVADHRSIVRRLLNMNLQGIFLIGEEFQKALEAEKASDKVLWFGSSDDLAQYLRTHPVEGCTILIKGSHSIQMEKAVPEL
jgi:UDP-N-acetylmuramoyl-tripeptide--D-alanyl-D-alanine ligase